MNDQSSQADHHEGRLARLAHRLAEEDPSPELPRGVRIAMTAGPFVGFGFILLIGLILSGREMVAWLAGAEVASFIGLGKFVVFGGIFGDAVAQVVGHMPKSAPPSPWVFAGLIIYGDLATTLVMMANMTLLYRMPFVGRRLAACHEAGWYVLRVHPWMRRVAWLGVAIFVAAPFQGTGAVVGTILGRLLGLSRLSTLSAMVCGSATGCSSLALLGAYGRQRVLQLARHPIAAVIIFAATVVVLTILGRWFTGESLRRERETTHTDDQPL